MAIFPPKLTLFLSTPSARRATLAIRAFGGYDDISIHALREEGDSLALCCSIIFRHFYPRPPRGGRRAIHAAVPAAKVFLSTPSARRATKNDGFHGFLLDISIHALREEGDTSHGAGGGRGRYFYPRPPRGGRLFNHAVQHFIRDHALREEGDCAAAAAVPTAIVFLSTPSARRATCILYRRRYQQSISIHALREEGDFATLS